MQEDKNIKIETLPERKPVKKEKPAIIKPTIGNKSEPLEDALKLDISYIKSEGPLQSVVDIIMVIGSSYGFINVCYLIYCFIANILSDFVSFVIPF